MLRYFYVFIFMLSVFSNVLSGQTTFAKSYNEVSDIHSIMQTDDGGYIFSGTSNLSLSDSILLVKTNAFGNVVWKKNFPGNSRSSVIQTRDQGYALLTNFQDKDEIWKALLIKTNGSGDTIWTSKYDEVDYINYSNILQSSDNGFLIIFNRNISTPNLIKSDKSGNLEWQIILNQYFSFRPLNLDLKETKGGSFLVNSLNHFLELTSQGATLIDTTFKALHFDSFSDNTHVFYNTSYELVKVDSSFNKIWSKQLGSHSNEGIYDLHVSNENVILVEKVLHSSRIIKMDSSGTEQLSLNKELIIQSVNESDSGFVFAGKGLFINGAVLKTDKNFGAKYVILKKPQDNSKLERSRFTEISWISESIDNVNLFSSINNGLNWQLIQSDIPAENELFEWQTPGYFNDSLKIRITASDDSTITDQNELPLTTGAKTYDYIATNECLMWFGNNGDGSHDPNTSGSGFLWPGGEQANQYSIFEDGLIWGGKVNGEPRANGNTHRQGIQPGNILETGDPADPKNPRFGIWRARSGWELFPPGAEKDRMQYDWQNWPVDLGAPWDDNDGNRLYDPQIDNPKVTGDETFWMVMNDLDTTLTRFTYGADPNGLEIQLQVYAYNRTDDLADAVFKKYRIFNKGLNQVDSMYFGYWSDPDLGGASDDFVGCDTTLNLAYCYNGTNSDGIYGSPPPAVGYLLLQGPVFKADVGDSAYFDNSWINGFKNYGMTSFLPFVSGDNVFRDPIQGVVEGSSEMYNILQGHIWMGNPVIDPNTGYTTRHALAGDPAAGKGWYEGPGWPGGPRADDRRMVMSSGPFDFAPGDSQEVVIAIIMARGINYLDSVTELKKKAAAIRNFYYTGILTAIEEQNYNNIPLKFKLAQNYPNPFNPVTTIHYQLAKQSAVKLSVYDALGRRVKTLVSKKQTAGSYKVLFDSARLASGLYFYKLEAGDFVQTRKMLLIR